MNYSEALDYIHSFLKFGSKPGLERVLALLAENGNPQENLRIVHVAGTNGKGTVSTMLSNILIESGKKVGLFTSPYVVDFCERIQVNGEMVSHDDLISLVEKNIPKIEKLNSEGIYPTEFELITAMAFDYFKSQDCDIVVLEVGLGGIYDSTNVVKSPELSVITHIAYDHTAILGDTLTDITLHKCGIIKQDCPTVSYPFQEKEALDVIKSECKNKNSELSEPDVDKLIVVASDISGSNIIYNDTSVRISLPGEHQILNAITAFKSAEILGIDNETISKGIEKTTLPARIEIMNSKPIVILDGGHNTDGAQALCNAVKDIDSYIAVVCMMEDKEVEKSLSYLLKNAEQVVATSCSNPRAMKAEELQKKCEQFCDITYAVDNPEEAFDKAMELSSGEKNIVVCGSLYLSGEIREHMKNTL